MIEAAWWLLAATYVAFLIALTGVTIWINRH